MQYGRLVEDARAEIEASRVRSPCAQRVRNFVFGTLLQSPRMLSVAGTLLYLFEASGLKLLARGMASIGMLGKLGDLIQLAPSAEPPFFFSQHRQEFPAHGERRYRVAFLAGCIANVSFARLNEATVRVLHKNGCEVSIPAGQTCCGALHLHSGLRDEAEALARVNIERSPMATSTPSSPTPPAAVPRSRNTASCWELSRCPRTSPRRVRDVTEFLASIELNRDMGAVNATVTYQDSCHLAHGQNIRTAPRKLLNAIPGLKLREMRGADLCCGSAGIYNVVAERDVDAPARSEDGIGERHRRRKSSPRPIRDACCNCRRACDRAESTARHARGGAARSGLRGGRAIPRRNY